MYFNIFDKFKFLCIHIELNFDDIAGAAAAVLPLLPLPLPLLLPPLLLHLRKLPVSPPPLRLLPILPLLLPSLLLLPTAMV